MTADQDIHWVDKLTLKITRVYAGDLKKGDEVIVGLAAYRKATADPFATGRFGKGDHLILFIAPVTQKQWKDDGIPYWPVSSGLKLVADGKVTGIEQESNPGAYVNTIDEGKIDEYRKKIESAVKWSGDFRKTLKEKKSDAGWLLEQLKARPVIKKESWGVRDWIAIKLCEAIVTTGDKETIERAKKLREDRLEQQILGLPKIDEKDESASC